MTEPPIFEGRQILVRRERDLLAFHPVRGHVFEFPPDTSALYLPPETVLSVEVSPREHGVALRIRGSFDRVDRGDMVILAPLEETEAIALIGAVDRHLGLPRVPRLRRPEELAGIDVIEYVSVEGVYAPGHFESADFEGAKLRGSRANRMKAGQRYRIEGFLVPHRGPPNVGYSGAFLHCFDVEPV
jgi:hypothetical protein